MLSKLIKYDIKSMLKFISVFYILGIFFAILTRIFFSFDNSLMLRIIGEITSGAVISMMISILINNLMRSWVRFKNTLYDDESYLTHTLPIDKKTIYLSKVITSFLVMLISFVFIAIILFIAYYSKANIETLKNILFPIATLLNSTVIKFLFIIFFLVFLELFSILLCGFLGIIIGHIFNKNKIVYSVVFGFISYMITQTIVVLIILIISLFNKDLMNIFISNEINNMSVLSNVSIISIIIYNILIIVNIIVSIKIFKKGVNVD